MPASPCISRPRHSKLASCTVCVCNTIATHHAHVGWQLHFNPYGHLHACAPRAKHSSDKHTAAAANRSFQQIGMLLASLPAHTARLERDAPPCRPTRCIGHLGANVSADHEPAGVGIRHPQDALRVALHHVPCKPTVLWQRMAHMLTRRPQQHCLPAHAELRGCGPPPLPRVGTAALFPALNLAHIMCT
jgi:hypothetical protein